MPSTPRKPKPETSSLIMGMTKDDWNTMRVRVSEMRVAAGLTPTIENATILNRVAAVCRLVDERAA